MIFNNALDNIMITIYKSKRRKMVEFNDIIKTTDQLINEMELTINQRAHIICYVRARIALATEPEKRICVSVESLVNMINQQKQGAPKVRV